MGDARVSDGCRANEAAGWIDNQASFPSGHQHPPRFPGCRCNCQSRAGSRKELSGLPQDRWIVTRDGDTVTVKRNPKYDDIQTFLKAQTKYPVENLDPAESTVDYSHIAEVLTPYVYTKRKDLTENEIAGLKSYQRDSSDINSYMRKGGKGKYSRPKSEIEVEITSIQSAMDKSATPIDIPLFRGISFDYAYQIMQTSSINDPAFLSTTLSPDKAIEYSKIREQQLKITPPDGFTNILILEIPRGSNAIYLGEDEEVLLSDKTKWNVVKVENYQSLRFDIPYNNLRLIYINRRE